MSRPRRTPVHPVGVAVVAVLVLAGTALALWWTRPERRDHDDRVGRDCPHAPPVPLRLEVVEEIPHDPAAFTQGLVAGDDGRLFESTGLEGRSSLRDVEATTGDVVRMVDLDAELFGEGLAVGAGGELVQLTWTEGRALRWDPDTLEARGEFRYDGEGWGLAGLGDGRFAMSDGSSRITLRDVDDFAVLDRLEVHRYGAGGAEAPGADQLNELEWDGERLWANRWRTDEIVRIDLRCARIDGVLDASSLTGAASAAAREAGQVDMDVLNGIAHLGGDELLLTGKRWPVMFRVRVTERS